MATHTQKKNKQKTCFSKTENKLQQKPEASTVKNK